MSVISQEENSKIAELSIPEISPPEDYNSIISLLLPENYLKHPINNYKSSSIGLLNYYFSLSVVEDAILNFLDFRFKNFDPLIGNNSCYLSSYSFFLISKKFTSSNLTLLRLALNSISKIKLEIIQKSKNSQNSSISLENFLMNERLDIKLDLDIVYLGLSYGCTLAKHRNKNHYDEIDYEKLLNTYQEKLNIEIKRKSVIKIVKHWQKVISLINVRTLQNHARDILSKENLWSKYIHNDYVHKDPRGRPCTASLYAIKTIYSLLLLIPSSLIGLQVNIHKNQKEFIGKFTINFEVQEDQTLKLVDLHKNFPNSPVYTFAGCRYCDSQEATLEKTKDDFIKRNLEEIIFAHEVTYPQYPKSLKIPDIAPKEFELRQEISRLKFLKGFSLKNPSDICLAHIFVDNTCPHISALEDNPLYLPQIFT